MRLKSVYIIGSMGSGKTYLANKLSQKIKVANHELDEIYWKKKYSEKREYKERQKIVNAIIKKKKWIVEGIYSYWTDPFLKKADITILLDYGPLLLTWRLLRRYFKKMGKSHVKFKDTRILIKCAWNYRKSWNREGLKGDLERIRKNKAKYKIIRNNNEMRQFIRSLK